MLARLTTGASHAFPISNTSTSAVTPFAASPPAVAETFSPSPAVPIGGYARLATRARPPSQNTSITEPSTRMRTSSVSWLLRNASGPPLMLPPTQPAGSAGGGGGSGAGGPGGCGCGEGVGAVQFLPLPGMTPVVVPICGIGGTTARTIGVCLERFSHKKRFGRQLLS